jgi:translation initiation factor 4E
MLSEQIKPEEYSELLPEETKKPEITSSQHKLNADWGFWYISRKEKEDDTPYSERLKKVVNFNTLEDFFKYYMFLKSASEVERNTDLALFKEGYKPLWECCPDGGCWFIRFKKNDDPSEIDIKWERLLFALVGEQFGELNIIGASLSVRTRETIIELWFNYYKDEGIKSRLGKKMEELLEIEKPIILYFKDNERSIKDKSTLKNAETYNWKLQKQRKSTYY